MNLRVNLEVVKIPRTKNKINKNMTLGEIVTKYPKSTDILMKYGLHCIGCSVAMWETLEQGAMAHGIDGKKLDNILKELNKLKEMGKNEKKH